MIDLGEELLALTEKVEVAHFLEASSRVEHGPYDLALVEGSVSTPREVELLREVREKSRIVVAFGSCAVYGGVQALRNWMDPSDVKARVYPNPDWVQALDKSSPVSEYIKVDYSISGCPPDGRQLMSVLKQILTGRRVYYREEGVCQECKRRGNVCVMVARGIPCLGPVIKEGCGALCPSYGRGCYGCFGPMMDPRPAALLRRFEEIGMEKGEAILKLKSFISGWSEPIRRVVDRYEQRQL